MCAEAETDEYEDIVFSDVLLRGCYCHASVLARKLGIPLERVLSILKKLESEGKVVSYQETFGPRFVFYMRRKGR